MNAIEYSQNKIVSGYIGTCDIRPTVVLVYTMPSRLLRLRHISSFITLTCPCSEHPPKPHFFQGKLGFAGIKHYFYNYFYKHRLRVLNVTSRYFVFIHTDFSQFPCCGHFVSLWRVKDWIYPWLCGTCFINNESADFRALFVTALTSPYFLDSGVV